MENTKIEKIFNAHFKDNSGEKPERFCESSDLSLEDQKWFQENTPYNQENIESKVKVNRRRKVSYLGDVTYDSIESYLGNRRNDNNDNLSYKLAKILDDLENLPYYEKLVSERRMDFLRNCLIITLNAQRKGIIRTTIAKYFTGVVKARTAGIKRIRQWEERNKR